MNLVGIIGAMEEEVLVLRDKMSIDDVRSIAGMEYVSGKISGRSVILVRSGIGKVNAAVCAQIMIDVFRVDAVINLGVAGALDEELDIYDLVISKDAVQHDFDAQVFGYQKGQIPRMEDYLFQANSKLIHMAEKAANRLSAKQKVVVGRVASGDQFISSEEIKKHLRDDFSAACAEMEGAAVAHVCYLNQVPFVIIRSISDKADKSADVNYEVFTEKAAEHSAILVIGMMEML